MNNKLLIEQIICSNYIKYEQLTKIVNEAFAGSDKENINIYIDLYSIFKKLYSSNYDIDDYSTVTSCIINMCAHYREFFKTRYRCKTTFYIVYSDNIPYVNRQLISKYNEPHNFTINASRKVYDMIRENCGLLKTICPYLPNINYIETTFESSVLIYDLMSKTDMNNQLVHMVITKDTYAYQLVNLKPDTIILRPKKHNSLDLSFYVNQKNVIEMYFKYRKWKSSAMGIYPTRITQIIALTTFPERNIKSMFSIKQVLDSIKMNSIDSLIMNDIINQHRYNAIDIIFQHVIFMDNPESKYTLTDLYDIGGIQEINNKYFIKNPLDLNRL